MPTLPPRLAAAALARRPQAPPVARGLCLSASSRHGPLSPCTAGQPLGPGWASPATVGKAEGFHMQPGQRPHFGSWLGPGPSAPQDGSGRCLWTLCEVGGAQGARPLLCRPGRSLPPVERGPRARHSLPPLSVLALRPWCLRGRREVRCQTRVRANPDPAPLKPRTQSPKRTRMHGAAAPRLCRLGRRRWGQRP